MESPPSASFPLAPDPAVPVLETLLGPEASDVLDAALGPLDGPIAALRATQIRYMPGASAVVQYRADIRGKNGAISTETLVASTGVDPPTGATVVSDGQQAIAVWRYPNDPHLPGLAVVLDPKRLRPVLTQLGITADDATARIRVYRPSRRAVAEVEAGGARIFIKVLRPSKVAAVHRTHIALAAHVPVPHSLGWSEPLGLIGLQALPGQSLRQTLATGNGPVPSPATLVELLDAFPGDGPDKPVMGPRERSAQHIALLSAILPDQADRIHSLATRLTHPSEPEAPAVAVHGDFHASQILIHEGAIAGLIDVDTAGRGSRLTDLATLLGHISVLRLTTDKPAFKSYGAELVRAFDRLSDPRTLRASVSAVVLGLATGPFRVQHPQWRDGTIRRIALAERWADEHDENHL